MLYNVRETHTLEMIPKSMILIYNLPVLNIFEIVYATVQQLAIVTSQMRKLYGDVIIERAHLLNKNCSLIKLNDF